MNHFGNARTGLQTIFFDGHNSIFAIHCLIEYTEDAQCDPQLKQAIHLLFGNDKFLQITLNDK